MDKKEFCEKLLAICKEARVNLQGDIEFHEERSDYYVEVTGGWDILEDYNAVELFKVNKHMDLAVEVKGDYTNENN
jgi:hypothetical protein